MDTHRPDRTKGGKGMIIKTVELSCDTCLESTEHRFHTIKEAVFTMRKDGWLINGENVKCRECSSPQPKADKEENDV